MERLVITVAAIVIAAALTSSPASAEPKNGVGVFAATGTTTYTETEGGEEYVRSAIGTGIDYQFALGKSLSISPYLEKSGGSNPPESFPDAATIEVSSIGVQARYWLGGLFLGIHAGQYVLATSSASFSVDISAAAAGQGFIMGFEAEQGWFIAVRSDTADGLILADNPTVDVNSNRLLFGYRWK